MSTTSEEHGATTGVRPLLSISIVSHANGRVIEALLNDLQKLRLPGLQIIVTLNIPEDESFLMAAQGLAVTVLRNARPFGYGENHNRAFARSTGRYFCVTNPDIRLSQAQLFEALQLALQQENVGVAAPLVLSPAGSVEDSFRRFPSIARLGRRVLSRRARQPEYPISGEPTLVVDWVAGMFMVFRREIFANIGGFDTRYFMYLEDADICRRLSREGRRTIVVTGVSVVHAAQRRSHRDLRHLSWHMRSAMHFLFGF